MDNSTNPNRQKVQIRQGRMQIHGQLAYEPIFFTRLFLEVFRDKIGIDKSSYLHQSLSRFAEDKRIFTRKI